MPKSKSDIHLTPDKIFDMIKEYYDYSKEDLFDPCPLEPDFDGLEISWKDVNFVNPPYTLLSEFIQKALEERPKKTIMLLPAKTDQPWFHLLYYYWPRIIWIKGRLKFKNDMLGKIKLTSNDKKTLLDGINWCMEKGYQVKPLGEIP